MASVTPPPAIATWPDQEDPNLTEPPAADAPTPGPPGDSAVLRLIGAIRRFNVKLHYVGGAALVALLALTVSDITGRSVFKNPVSGTVEVTALILVVIVFLGLAHSEDLGDHITVDLIYVRLGDRGKKFLDYFANILSVVVIGMLSYQLYKFALRQNDAGATTPVLRWPTWPFVIVGALGSLGYAGSILFKLVLRAMGQPTEAVDAVTGQAGGVEGGGIEI